MSLQDTTEAHAALLTAGVVLLAVGILIATLPAGLMFGVVVTAVGAVLVAVTAVLAWPEWRTPHVRREAVAKDPDRFWNAETRLKSAIIASAGIIIAATAISLLKPQDERWVIVWVYGVILIVVSAAFAVVRWRRARREGAARRRD